MELAVADRRLLKAFYTQYVAVLLIVLTFCVGAFQRCTAPTINAPLSRPHVREIAVGAFAVPGLFGADGSLVRSHPKLAALIDVLHNHDVNVRATLVAGNLEFDADSPSIERQFMRMRALDVYLAQQQVPRDAVTILTGTTARNADAQQDGDVVFELYRVEEQS